MYEKMRKRLREERRQLWAEGLTEESPTGSFLLAETISHLLAADELLLKAGQKKNADAGKP